ncbi:hypothetical protein K8S19_12500, partial [bacterium]|nr:hypothetical protein [bacterium]
GAIVGYQADKYYFQSRYDSLADTLGRARMETARGEEDAVTVENLRGGETAASWYSTERQKVGIQATDLTRLVGIYLAEANQVLGRQADTSMEALRLTLDRELEKGAEPSLAALMRILSTLEGVEQGSVAAVLREMAKQGTELDGTVHALLFNGVMASLITGEVTAVPGSARRNVESVAAVADQTVHLMSMPVAFNEQLSAVRTAIRALRSRPEADGLVSRLEMIEKAIAEVTVVSAGQMGQLGPVTGLQLKAEIARLAKIEKTAVFEIGEDLSRKMHGVVNGNVESATVDGIALAAPLVYEVALPIGQRVSDFNLTGKTLPTQVQAVQYQGAVEAVMEIPQARSSLFLGLSRITSSRRIHQMAMQQNPMGYFEMVVNRMGITHSNLNNLLSQPDSPVVQAYLRYVERPVSRTRERNFVKSMLRVLKVEGRTIKTEADQAGFEVSIAAFNDLVGQMHALAPRLELGVWEDTAQPNVVGKPIFVPGVLIQIGGKGALGAYYDILHTVPARIDENSLEKQRRKLFRSATVAA